MIRRLGSVIVALLALNVSAAEALRLCVSQARHELSTTATTSSEHQHHEHHPVPAEREPVENSPPASCCDAMTSCGISVALGRANDQTTLAVDRPAVIPAAPRAPSFDGPSPEPPPPKVEA